MKKYLHALANLQVSFALLFFAGALFISVCINDEVGGHILRWGIGSLLSLCGFYLLVRVLIKITVGLKDKDPKKESLEKHNPQNTKKQ